MRVLFDIVHPADVHFFRLTIQRLLRRGDEVCIAARRKDVTLELLDTFGLGYHVISTQGRGVPGLFAELIQRDIRLLGLARKFNPDVMVANNSPCAAHVARILRVSSIVFDDTEIHRHNRMLYYPAVTEVHSPSCYRLSLGRKQRLYPGYHTLAYLHPDHFTPKQDVMRDIGLIPGRSAVLLRFVAWGAMHDMGLAGLSRDDKHRLVHRISEKARVLISSEAQLDKELESYRITIPVDRMHDLLAFVDIVIGESATMCSEAVSLGTPAIYIDEKGRGYTDEQERDYGLCFNFRPDQYSCIERKVLELLELQDIKGHFEPAWRRMLREKINVSDYQLQQIDRLGARARS